MGVTDIDCREEAGDSETEEAMIQADDSDAEQAAILDGTGESEAGDDAEQPTTTVEEEVPLKPVASPGKSAAAQPLSPSALVLSSRDVKRAPWQLATGAVLLVAGAAFFGAMGIFKVAQGSDFSTSAQLGQSGVHRAPQSPQQSAHKVASALRAYARQGGGQKAELDKLHGQVERAVDDMSATDVATTLNAYARMQQRPGHALLAALSRRARQVVGTMSADDVANVVSAYAELSEHSNPDDVADPHANVYSGLERQAELDFEPEEDLANPSGSQQRVDSAGPRTPDMAGPLPPQMAAEGSPHQMSGPPQMGSGMSPHPR